MTKSNVAKTLRAFLPLAALVAAGPAPGQNFSPPVVSQQINPTVLAPASRGALPQGVIVVTPPQATMNVPPPPPPAESVQHWQNALPGHRHHHHYRQTGDDHH